MAYKNVSKEDLGYFYDSLSTKGFKGAELESKIRQAADLLEQERTQPNLAQAVITEGLRKFDSPARTMMPPAPDISEQYLKDNTPMTSPEYASSAEDTGLTESVPTLWAENIKETLAEMTVRPVKRAVQQVRLGHQFDVEKYKDEGLDPYTLADIQTESSKIPMLPEVERFHESDGWIDSLVNFAKAPHVVLPSLILTSLPSQLIMMGKKAPIRTAIGATAGTILMGPGKGTKLGATVGAGQAAFEVSKTLEYSGQFMESLEEAGIDTRNPEALDAAFKDRDLMARVKQIANAKAIPVAFMDAVSFGLGSQVVKGVAKKTIGKKAVQLIGAEMIPGMAGEALGQYGAGANELDEAAVLAEGLGELGGGDIIINKMLGKRYSPTDRTTKEEKMSKVMEVVNKLESKKKKKIIERFEAGDSLSDIMQDTQLFDLKPSLYHQAEKEAQRPMTPTQLKERVENMSNDELAKLGQAWGVVGLAKNVKHDVMAIIDELNGQEPQGLQLVESSKIKTDNKRITKYLESERDTRVAKTEDEKTAVAAKKNYYQKAIDALSEFKGNIYETKSVAEVAEILNFKSKNSKIATAVFNLIQKDKRNIEEGGESVVLMPVFNKPEQGEVERGKAIGTKLREFFDTQPTDLDYVIEGIRTEIKEGNEGWVDALHDILIERVGEEEANNIVTVLKSEPDTKIDLAQKGSRIEQTDKLIRVTKNALSKVLPENIVNKIIDSSTIDITKEDRLNEVLTRDQYSKYMKYLEGELRQNIENEKAENAWLTAEADIDASVTTPIPLSDGGYLDVTTVPTPGELTGFQKFFRRWGSLQPAMDKLQEVFGIKFQSMNRSMEVAQNMTTKATAALSVIEKYYWKKIPRALRAGRSGAMLSDLISYLGTTEEMREAYAEQHGVENTVEAMVDRVRESMPENKKMTSEQILQHAELNAKHNKSIYDWFIQNGIADPEMYIKNYVPIIRLYQSDVEQGNKKTVTEWLNEKRKDKNKKEAVNNKIQQLSEKEFVDLKEIVSIDETLKRQNVPVKGQHKESMEYQRKLDEGFIKTSAYLTGSRELMSLYMHKMLKKHFFRPLVPAILRMRKQVNDLPIDSGQKEVINRVMDNYLASIGGIPHEMALAMKKVNLKATPNFFIKLSNKAFHIWNKTPGLNKIHQFTDIATIEKITADDIRQIATSYMYAAALGIPNWKSPMKNILTQNVHAVAMLGLPTYLKGMVELFGDPGRMKYIASLDLRPETAWSDEAQADELSKRVSATTRIFMQVFRASDLLNVFNAASSAITAWERIEPLLDTKEKQDTITLEETVQGLWQGKPPNPKQDAAIIKSTPDNLKFWDGAISKPITLEIFDRIQQGKVEEAKTMWIQYIVSGTQWKYGPGGTSILFRNPIWRTVYPFRSWSMNYVDFINKTLVQGVNQARKGEGTTILQRYIQMYSVQWALGAILMNMGVKGVQKWFGLGPFQGLAEPGGIITDKVMRLLDVAGGTSEAVQGGMMGMDPEEHARVVENLGENFGDLMDFMY